MPEQTDTLIGHLLEVRNGRFVAKLLNEKDGFRPTLKAADEVKVVGQVGSYVSVRQHGFRSLALINHVEADRSDRKSCRSAAGCLVALTPLGQITEDGVFHRGVRHFPTPGAEVHIVAEEEIDSIFAKHRQYQFEFGHLQPSLDGRSFGSVGLVQPPFRDSRTVGSGKSWSVVSLIQRMVDVAERTHHLARSARRVLLERSNQGFALLSRNRRVISTRGRWRFLIGS